MLNFKVQNFPSYKLTRRVNIETIYVNNHYNLCCI